ncbi:hypothetical protein CAPTEDRAFT_224889 [Capitella teleta]|uniref:Uncharacterized protein n=1 Tax=Capitella teleta TaxID=283909 RepID=R7TWB1_CAPTE|nr:hypothetical protein CAPTEDRAFT_224889 [Capitella teleta]|eukprot:ELT97862.1 hypothetical protein CAPTEDRAFT_224889 [Capitella teleta]
MPHASKCSQYDTSIEIPFHPHRICSKHPFTTTIATRDRLFQLNAPNSQGLWLGSSKDEKWSLHIEKCILSTKTLPFETDFENDLICTIREFAVSGARLACAEPVGFVRSESTNTQYGIMGVELFFNLPKHPTPVIYAYHTVTVHANYHIMPDTTQTIQQVTCDADFMGQLTVFLSKGWKLVNICIDITAIADAYKMKASSKTVETIWIFEKEANKLYAEEPEYEGVIIEYLHKVKKGLDNKEVPCKDWRPVIAGMGVSGWELAGIIQTPLLIQSSFTTYTMKLLMVFQRRINPSMQRLIKESCSSVPSTPAGRKKERDIPAGVFGTVRRGSTGEGGSGHAYYHHTLKRYIYGDEPIGNGPVMNGVVPQMKARSEPDVIPPGFKQNCAWT